MKAALIALLVLLTALPAYAEDLVASFAICKEEKKALASLQQQLQAYRTITGKIDAVIEGTAPGDLTAQALGALLSGNDGETAPGTWPAETRCSKIADEYQKSRQALDWEKQQLARLRKQYWSGVPESARQSLLFLWNSRAYLASNERALPTAGSGVAGADVAELAAAWDAQLRRQRLAFLELLPGLAGEIDAGKIQGWLEHWHDALDTVGQMEPPPASLLGQLPAETRAALERHFMLAQLDAMSIAESFDTVRGWLWQQYRPGFKRATAAGPGRVGLLYDEARAVRNLFHWFYADAATGSGKSLDGSSTLASRFYQGFEYLVGLLGFVALALLAKRLKAPAVTLQGHFARHFRGNRARAQIVRFTSGIPELLPWIVGWFGLGVLEYLFRHHHLPLMIPLLPFARLYVVYGLLCLVGEWFLHRIADLAGSYLSGEQQEKMAHRARRFARIVILPWLLKDLVALTLGPSLTLEILDWLTIAAALAALGLLLKPWQKEFIKALQAFIPESWDPLCERVFGGRSFVVFAPLAAPVALMAMLLFFLHKGLVDFDWYRKLMARSFKLRSMASEEEAIESDAAALAEYRRWFDDTVEDTPLPFIGIDAAQRLQRHLSTWLAETTEENSLLISGERGSGKTTLLGKARDWLAGQENPPEVHHLQVPAKTADPAAVAALLEPVLGVTLAEGPAQLVRSDQTRQPTVLILDNAQNFFLREVGGLNGWEFLLSLTRARLHNLYWIVVMNNQSWAYVANVFGRDYQFNSQLQTRAWSQNDIRSLILSRNQLSGCHIRYDSILLSTRGPEAGNIRNAEQLYFSLLWDACRGNPLLALDLWMTSVTVNGNSVTVGLPAEVAAGDLERLGEDLHFVYAALVMHENMTSDELVKTTAMPESLVRAALKIAFDVGFVERSVNRRYRVVPLWYPALTRLLARKNLLHE